jgi:hypothetical protein
MVAIKYLREMQEFNEFMTNERRLNAAPRVITMEQHYKEQLKGSRFIGNQQYLVIPNFITEEERNDMFK